MDVYIFEQVNRYVNVYFYVRRLQLTFKTVKVWLCYCYFMEKLIYNIYTAIKRIIIKEYFSIFIHIYFRFEHNVSLNIFLLTIVPYISAIPLYLFFFHCVLFGHWMIIRISDVANFYMNQYRIIFASYVCHEICVCVCIFERQRRGGGGLTHKLMEGYASQWKTYLCQLVWRATLGKGVVE